MTEFLKQCAEKDTLTAEDRKRLVEVADKVAEVGHAEWINYKDISGTHCYCRKCGSKEYKPTNYCSSCGAKMGSEAE